MWSECGGLRSPGALPLAYTFTPWCSIGLKLWKLAFTSGNRKKLTPWSAVLLQKLTVTQLVEKFSAFYGTRRFISLFTRSHHCFLSWARWIQSTTSHTISLRSILIISFHLRLGLPQKHILKFCFVLSYVVLVSILQTTDVLTKMMDKLKICGTSTKIEDRGFRILFTSANNKITPWCGAFLKLGLTY
jgi:hypothetical protein